MFMAPQKGARSQSEGLGGLFEWGGIFRGESGSPLST